MRVKKETKMEVWNLTIWSVSAVQRIGILRAINSDFVV